MLAGIDGLFERERGFGFHDKEIEIFSHQDLNGVGQAAHDANFELAGRAKHVQGAVLENRIGIENKKSDVHGSRCKEQEACRQAAVSASPVALPGVPTLPPSERGIGCSSW